MYCPWPSFPVKSEREGILKRCKEMARTSMTQGESSYRSFPLLSPWFCIAHFFLCDCFTFPVTWLVFLHMTITGYGFQYFIEIDLGEKKLSQSFADSTINEY